jgi:hypothetical protein
MIRSLLYRLTANRPCRLISRDGTPYLERYFVCQVFGLTIYLHRFVSGDGDEEVHNHPWNSIAICLAGGYMEERMTGLCMQQGWRRIYRKIIPGRINRIRANDFHRILATKPETWTLFVHGKTRIGWGFLRTTACYYGLPSHNLRVEFHQPYPLTNGSQWWHDAPLGKHATREPQQ